MGLPTKKRAKSRKKVKQYQHRLKKINLGLCPKCKKPVRPHHVCSFCGTYAGREVISKKSKVKGQKSK